MALRSWGNRAFAVVVLAACGGRSTVGLTSDGTYGGVAAAGGGGGVAAGSGGGGTGALGGNGARAGAAGGGGVSGGGSAGTTNVGASGALLTGGASGTSGAGAGGSAGKVPHLGDDPYLRSLTVKEGYLAPKFDPLTSGYSVTVPRGTLSLSVEAVPNDPNATIEVGGVVGHGPVEVSIPVSPDGEFPIVVTAPSQSRITTHIAYHEELVESSTYLKPSHTEEFAQFGIAVAVSGDTVAVGAYTETGMTATGESGPLGAVYVYVKDDAGWQQQAFLQPSNANLYEQFGYALALSGDTLVVGAPGDDGSAGGVNGDETSTGDEGAGAAYVLTREGGIWTQQAYVKATNPERNGFFGGSVALEGNTLVVGASGQSVAAGDRTSEPLLAAGAATVLVRDGTTWAVQDSVVASRPSEEARFGSSVALSGERLVVAAVGEGSTVLGVDGSGAPGAEGGEAAPLPWSGAVYVFARRGDAWVEEAALKGPNPVDHGYFGNGVALLGDRLVVGASGQAGPFSSELGAFTTDAGAAYVFQRVNDTWVSAATLLPSSGGQGHHFGARIAMQGDLIVVGAPGETGSSSGVNGDPSRGGALLSGAAYVFALDMGRWYQREYLKAVTSDPNDGFGISLSLDDGKLAVGAYGESSNATGVNGDSQNNSVQGAGAAYVYELSE